MLYDSFVHIQYISYFKTILNSFVLSFDSVDFIILPNYKNIWPIPKRLRTSVWRRRCFFFNSASNPRLWSFTLSNQKLCGEERRTTWPNRGRQNTRKVMSEERKWNVLGTCGLQRSARGASPGWAGSWIYWTARLITTRSNVTAGYCPVFSVAVVLGGLLNFTHAAVHTRGCCRHVEQTDKLIRHVWRES